MISREEAARVCLDLRCRWCREAGETSAYHPDCCACRDDAAALRALPVSPVERARDEFTEAAIAWMPAIRNNGSDKGRWNDLDASLYMRTWDAFAKAHDALLVAQAAAQADEGKGA